MSELRGILARKSPRRQFVREMGILYSGQYMICMAAQISEGGVLAMIPEDLILPKLIVVSILMPGGGYAISRAEILYQQGKMGQNIPNGVKFQGLPLQQRRMIRNYVAAKTQVEAEKEAQ